MPSDDENVDAGPGWAAIDAAMHTLYPGQEPQHWAPKDKLPSVGPGMDGLSAYDAGDHWHFVTYGLTELYSKEPTKPRRKGLLRRRENPPEPGTAEADDSGFGFEFTLRVPHGLGEEPPAWALTLLESLVDTVFGGLFLAPGHTLDPGGPITGEPTTRLTALLFVKDTELRPLDTANGFVGFLQVVGITSEELAAIKEDRSYADRLRDGNPLLLTDPTR